MIGSERAMLRRWIISLYAFTTLAASRDIQRAHCDLAAFAAVNSAVADAENHSLTLRKFIARVGVHACHLFRSVGLELFGRTAKFRSRLSRGGDLVEFFSAEGSDLFSLDAAFDDKCVPGFAGVGQAG